MSWGRPFQKGQSGNPGGRSSAASLIARRILKETKNGGELVDFALKVLRGEVKDAADAKSRRWACDYLTDRCAGKAPQQINVATDDAAGRVPYEVLTDAELAQYEAITLKLHLASAAAAQPEVSGDDGGHDGGGFH